MALICGRCWEWSPLGCASPDGRHCATNFPPDPDRKPPPLPRYLKHPSILGEFKYPGTKWENRCSKHERYEDLCAECYETGSWMQR